MTEQTNVPKLRFGGFADGWLMQKLGSIANINDGTHQTPKYVDEGVKFVSVENIKNIKNSSKFITKEAYEKDFKIKPQIGDILMTRITAGVIGATAIITDNEPLAYYVSLALIREKVGNHVPFLAHKIESSYFKRELHKRIIHVAFPKKINLGDIGDCEFSIPSIQEQQKIASFLSKVDEKISLLSEKKAKLTEYKKGAMQKLFDGKWQSCENSQNGKLVFIPPTLRFKADDGSEFGEWEEKALGDVLTIGNGKDYKHLSKGNIPVFGTGGHMLSVDDYIHDGESVFIGRKGTINKPYMYKGKFWTVDTLFYTKDFIDVLAGFIYLIFQRINWSLYNEATGVPSLSKSTINKINCLFPSLEEQKKITNFITTIDKKIDLTNSELEKAKEWKKGLLQQLFV